MLRTFFQRLQSFQNPVNRQKSVILELLILVVVWLVLSACFILANYHLLSQPKRYLAEFESYTAGIDNPRFLQQVCGETFLLQIKTSYKDKSFSDNCLSIESQPQTWGQGALYLEKIQNTLGKTWEDYQSEQRYKQLVKNETDLNLGDNVTISRLDWLNLNQQGKLNSINKLLELNKQLVKDQRIKPSELALAMYAVADGNTAFPFTELFLHSPDTAKLFNKTTREVAKIYASNANHQKAEQANYLLPFFGEIKHLGMMVQIMIWSLATWLMLLISRQTSQRFHPLLLLPIAMTIWGGIITLVSHSVILPAKAGLVIFCLGIALLVLLKFLPIHKLQTLFPDNRELSSSVWLYPLFVGFTTLGMLILFDYSSRGYSDASLRYLFLYHFQDLFLCYVIISLSRLIAYIFSVFSRWLIVNNTLHALWGNLASQRKKAWIWLGILAIGLLGLSFVLRQDPAKVAEFSKLWLILFFAVFLSISQRDFIQNLAKSTLLLFSPILLFALKIYAMITHKREYLDLLLLTNRKNYKISMIFLISVIFSVMSLLIAGEKGTIWVIILVLVFMLGVALSNYIYQRGGRGHVIGFLMSTVVLLAVMTVLINFFGDMNVRFSERVDLWRDPFNSVRDDLAILHWFRESTPTFGYGFGNIPWCGYMLSECRGIPKQMQSDYTMTSIIAVMGLSSIVLIVSYFAWLVWMAISHMPFSREQIQSNLLTSRYLLLSWIILVWVIVTIFQAIVTISGNLGILPLTGVTLPFLSYGASSLWFNSFMFSLVLFQPKLQLSSINQQHSNY